MNRSNLIKLLIALGFALVALLLPFGSLFGIEINPVEQRVVAMFVLAALFWILEPIPIWSTSVLIIVAMLFTISDKAIPFLMVGADGSKYSNLLSYKAVMGTWADPTIMLFMGGFFLAASATKYKLDINIARVLIKPFGKNPKNVLLGLMITVALFSMFMSNTASAAMFLAILAPVLAIFKENDKARIAFALAIPVGANLGGMGTPIGTPPNAIAFKGLADLGAGVSFGQWMLFAVPFMLVMLFFAWRLLIWLFPPTTKTIELDIGGKFMNTPRAKIVYVTFAITILFWMIGDFIGLNSSVVAMIPIAVFSITGVITSKDMNGMAWDVLWLVAGGFALGLGLQQTGLAYHLINAIPFSSFPVLLIIAVASLIAIFMSTFMSNSATAALLIPIVSAVAIALKVSGVNTAPMGGASGLLIAVGLSCSLAMSLPISTPPNSLAYATGFLKTKDMAKVGLLIGFVGIAVVIGMMSLLGHFNFFSANMEKIAAIAEESVAAEEVDASEVAIPESLPALEAEASVEAEAHLDAAAPAMAQ